METFQDLSLPIPGKEDLAKLHSAIYQNVPAKPGACGDSYPSQGWLAFIVEYIRRYAHPPASWGFQSGLGFLGLPAMQGQVFMGPWRAHGSRELEARRYRGVCWVQGLGHFGIAWTRHSLKVEDKWQPRE